MEGQFMSADPLSKILEIFCINSALSMKGRLNWGDSYHEIIKHSRKTIPDIKTEKYENGDQVLLQYQVQIMGYLSGISFVINSDDNVGLHEIDIICISNGNLLLNQIIKKIRSVFPGSEIKYDSIYLIEIPYENIDIIIQTNENGFLNIEIVPDKKNSFDYGDILLEDFDYKLLYDDKELDIDILELQFLKLLRELIIRQHEALNSFTQTIGIPAWDYWMSGIGKNDPDSHLIQNESADNKWQWKFHGNGSDFKHNPTESRLYVDFGINHRTDTFSEISLNSFKPNHPWKTFNDINEYLSGELSDPFLSNRALRLHEILRKLRMKNLIQYASVMRELNITPLGWKILLKT